MKRIITIWTAAATILSASAQNQNRESGGLLINRDIMTSADLLELTQSQFNFGTARAMAMAGAFTSLGADASSMTINPAGLGMYRKSEVTFSPMLSFSRSATADAAADGTNASGRFALSNFGVVVNVVNNSKGLVSLSFGVGYNRIADFNYNYAFRRSGQAASVADVFARHLAWSDTSKNSFYDNGGSGRWNWDHVPVDLWNAALAYRAFMVDQPDPEDPESWSPTWIGNQADVAHYTNVKSRGSVGEFDISVGGNVENIFYFGATIGIQSIRRRLYVDYAEDYLYADPSQAHPYGTDPALDYQLLYARLNQATVAQGAGVNFKVGMVLRPIPNLRLGLAIHTPTYYSVDWKFQASAASMAYANRDTDPNVHPDSEGYISSGTADMTSPLLFDESPYGWSFSSPTRLLTGVSYTFGQRALLSVDYERDWYGGVRLGDNPLGSALRDDYKRTIRDTFRAVNIVRVGAEFKVLPVFAVRAGFGYSGSILRHEQSVPASPVIKATTYFGAGVGYTSRRGGFSLDLAYQYMRRTSTDYYLFYVSEERPDGRTDFAESSLYRTKLARHHVALTVGFRF